MTHTVHVSTPIKPGTARRLGLRQPYAVIAQQWLSDTQALTAEQSEFVRLAYSSPPWRLRRSPISWSTRP